MRHANTGLIDEINILSMKIHVPKLYLRFLNKIIFNYFKNHFQPQIPYSRTQGEHRNVFSHTLVYLIFILSKTFHKK